MKKLLFYVISTLSLVIAVSCIYLENRYGGGSRFPDLTTAPTLSGDKLEIVANLSLPPGNIAVSEKGRVIFSYHPEAKPAIKIAEMVNGQAVELALETPPNVSLQNILGIRIDLKNRLWVLDNAEHGIGQPRLLAFNLDSLKTEYIHDFPSEIAGIGSHLNDLQVSKDGNYVYIADASIFAQTPAIIVHSTIEKKSRRILEGHHSVVPDNYLPVVQGKKMLMGGILAVRPGVDSIALSRDGLWLYFAPVTDEFMYRIKVSDIHDADIPNKVLEEKVERFAAKTMSDGITIDNSGRIYISDIENSAINRLWPDGTLETFIKDDILRWPDGFSFGPDGWLYVTSSSLQHVIFKSQDHILSKSPYHIFRVKTDSKASSGH